MDKAQIRQAREQIGWSQDRLAATLGIARAELTELERTVGSVYPSTKDRGRAVPSWFPYCMGLLLITGGNTATPWPLEDTLIELERMKEAQGLSWKDVAAVLNVHETTVRLWRNGRNPAPLLRVSLIIMWIRMFGTIDIFALPYKYEGVSYAPIRLAPTSLFT